MLLRRFILCAAVAATSLGLASVASAQCDTRFTLRNVSGMQVNEFYFGSSADSNWGADQLGQGVLPNGASMNFQSRFTGNHDFKVVWANGQYAELMRVNVCTTSEIVATPRGIEAR
jgi:hypothetical protein